MLLGFYSGLIVFVILFFVSSFFFIKEVKKKSFTTSPISIIMLAVLLIFTLTISVIYSYDFVKLQTDETKTTSGVCHMKFVNGHGNSIDTTEIKIDDKIYSIKSDQYNSLPDGTYFCEITYLPITKIVAEIIIKE